MDSPDWIKNKKATSPINDDDKCFHYAAVMALNHEKVGKHFQTI